MPSEGTESGKVSPAPWPSSCHLWWHEDGSSAPGLSQNSGSAPRVGESGHTVHLGGSSRGWRAPYTTEWAWESVGYERSPIEAFSQQREGIVHYLMSGQWHGPHARWIAAHRRRPELLGGVGAGEGDLPGYPIRF